MDLNMLKDMLLSLRTDNADMAMVLGSTFGDKPSLLVVLGQNRVDAGKNASNIVRQAGKEMQGGGGGQPFFAQAGGKKLDGLNSAMDKLMALFA
jgi:alanyl-tRNA synthetase